MTDPLDADLLARLRTWAHRRDPDRPDHPPHGFHAGCMWCAGDGAHMHAMMLLDEIDRLRAELERAGLSEAETTVRRASRPPRPRCTRGASAT